MTVFMIVFMIVIYDSSWLNFLQPVVFTAIKKIVVKFTAILFTARIFYRPAMGAKNPARISPAGCVWWLVFPGVLHQDEHEQQPSGKRKRG